MTPDTAAHSQANTLLARFTPPVVEYTYGQGVFVQPYKGDFDGRYIWICDRNQGCFHQCTAQGAPLARYGRPGPGPDAIGRPISVRVAPDGTVYLCDIVNQRLLRYGRDGHFMEVVRQGQFTDLVFNPTGNRVCLADVSRCAVLILDPAQPDRVLGQCRLPAWARQNAIFGLQFREGGELVIMTASQLFTADATRPDSEACPLTARHHPPLFRGFSVLPDTDIVVSNGTPYNQPTLVRYDRDGRFINELPLNFGGRNISTIGSFLISDKLHATCMNQGIVAVLDLVARETGR